MGTPITAFVDGEVSRRGFVGRKIQDNDNRAGQRTGVIVDAGIREDGAIVAFVKWSTGRTTAVVRSMIGKQTGTRGYRFIDEPKR